MKSIKRTIALICAIITLLVCFSNFASAATVSKDKQSVTGIRGGQTVYIKTNTAWNTNFCGGLYRTNVRIFIPIGYRDQYQKSAASSGKQIKITTFQRAGSSWVRQKNLSGSFFCNGYSGLLNCDLRLPGKGVLYKIVITPEKQGTVRTPSDMTGIKLDINYGTIVGVS